MPKYRKTSNISRTLVGNNVVDNSDVVGASRGFNGLDKDNCKTTWDTFKFWDLVRLKLEVLRYKLWLPCISVMNSTGCCPESNDQQYTGYTLKWTINIVYVPIILSMMTI